jgi:hypothetical protein
VLAGGYVVYGQVFSVGLGRNKKEAEKPWILWSVCLSQRDNPSAAVQRAQQGARRLLGPSIALSSFSHLPFSLSPVSTLLSFLLFFFLSLFLPTPPRCLTRTVERPALAPNPALRPKT